MRSPSVGPVDRFGRQPDHPQVLDGLRLAGTSMMFSSAHRYTNPFRMKYAASMYSARAFVPPPLAKDANVDLVGGGDSI